MAEETKTIDASVVEGADKDDFIDLNGRVITNYSARHDHITEAIMRVVDIYDISLNCGTDINYINRPTLM